MTREPVLQDFLSSVRDAIAARARGANTATAMGRIDEALASPGPPGSGEGRRLPACRYLPEALERARRHSGTIARIADAFAALEPALRWAPRGTGGPHASANWPEGHANATIVGAGGLESRDDLLIGVSLLAPHVRYPDHRHPPEEVYLVLSPGCFRHGASAWFEPGIGGTLYNEPDLIHAMASDDAPLFAVWHLWKGRTA